MRESHGELPMTGWERRLTIVVADPGSGKAIGREAKLKRAFGGPCEGSGALATGRRSTRRFVVAALALVAGATGLLTITPPERAEAWAWSDTCTFKLINFTGSQGSVRPILYTPFPPNPVSIALYAGLAVTGVPINLNPELSTTGIPVTWGCSQLLAVSNPGIDAVCTAAAPTTGANSFKCGGDVDVNLYEDSDNIRGELRFKPAQGGTEETADPTAPPNGEPDSSVLRRADLPGKGWRGVEKLTQLGDLGMLWDEASDPSCDDGEGEPEPRRGAGAAFSRRGGTQFIGVAESTHESVRSARMTLRQAVGDDSFRCLDKFLTSAEHGTTVAVEDQRSPAGARNAQVTRIEVTTDGSGSKGDRIDYLDVVGLRDGNRTAVLMLNSVDKPTPQRTSADVIEAVLRRIG
jgi:hypothetical protein